MLVGAGVKAKFNATMRTIMIRSIDPEVNRLSIFIFSVKAEKRLGVLYNLN